MSDELHADKQDRRREQNRIRQAKYRASEGYRAKRYASDSAAHKAYMVEYHRKWKLFAMRGYAGGGEPQCNCCGIKGLEFLSIDHVNNDGHVERKSKRGDASGLMLYRRIVREAWPDTFQVLCFNCNMAKAYFGVCPHKRVQ